MSVQDQQVILEDRINKEKAKIRKLMEKMENTDQEFTELDMNDLNVLKQSVRECQASLTHSQETGEPVPTPRVQVLPSSIDEPRTQSPRPASRSSRSRHSSRRKVRGRSKGEKRRHLDTRERSLGMRQRSLPVTVRPPVVVPKPTVASLFTGGPDELSSSCPTSQEPSQPMSVPQLFQAAGDAIQGSGSVHSAHPYYRAPQGRSDPPRDPRSQSKRRVVIQYPPSSETPTSGHHSDPSGSRPSASRWRGQRGVRPPCQQHFYMHAYSATVTQTWEATRPSCDHRIS